MPSAHGPIWRTGRTVVRVLALFSIVLLLGCDFSGKGRREHAISVGSTRVSLNELKSDFDDLIKALPVTDENRSLVAKEVLRQVIDRYLILEYGKEQRISLADSALNEAVGAIRRDYTSEGFREAVLRDYIDLDRWKRQLRKRLLVEKILRKVGRRTPPPLHTDILRYYNEHVDSFFSESEVKFRQIVTWDKPEAEAVLEKLRKGTDFGRLAAEISIAPEADRGGIVGWVTRGQLEHSMDSSLFGLEPGRLSPVIKSSFGYHVFQVLETRSRRMKTLPEAAEEIASKLFQQKQEQFLRKWLKGLRDRFKVYVQPNLLNLLES